ncbi:SRPBCC family protein [Paenibacillus sp. YPG26]|uniref:SRPBCC family protein n=1 Tax=Paenibacillus sp. YPG26 TaxID=2878915 RepID=UPI00203EB3BC|nr:SRPBCC family protein [Paenibacillus sp. YPG26]USB33489.1 SRPBCC family protein [Paenibacillus sp. YPG26]
MNNVTKMRISRPAQEVFDAFVEPSKIGNFWFSSSSERWEQGRTITLRYDEYDAQGDIYVKEMELNRRIVFEWGASGEGHVVIITLSPTGNDECIIEVIEEGFDAGDQDVIPQMLDNKEGWVYMLTCLKGYLEYGVNLRAALVK